MTSPTPDELLEDKSIQNEGTGKFIDTEIQDPEAV